MAYQIIMPGFGDERPLKAFRKWIVSENAEAGIGSVHTRTLGDLVRRLPLFACFHKWFVEEGEAVVPGQTIAEVYIDGVTVPITNHGFGIVESRVEMDDMTVLQAGDIIANIFERNDRSSKQKGLTPKSSTYQRWLRFGRPNLI